MCPPGSCKCCSQDSRTMQGDPITQFLNHSDLFVIPIVFTYKSCLYRDINF